MKQREKESVLEIEPKAVRKGIAAHYKNQFRKRAARLKEMLKRWKELTDLKKIVIRNSIVK